LATDAAELLASPVAEYVVSSISLWEIALKHHRGQLDLGISPKAFLARLHKMANMEIVDVTAGIWLASVALDWEHRDPADRVIVATAVSGNLPIVTRDQRILDFYAETIQA
jgi:PIN domain nuclease of toxin-antitoxin system